MSTSIPNTGLGLSETAALDSAPGDLLRQAKRLLDHAQDLVDQAVIAERVKGTSWEAIGTALDGVTKSAVQKRFGGRVSEWTKEFEREELPFEPMAPAFPTAWRQLAFHWAEADRIIHAQEHIAALTNATAAASGTDFNNGECEGFDTAGLAAALSVFAEVASRSTFPGGPAAKCSPPPSWTTLGPTEVGESPTPAWHAPRGLRKKPNPLVRTARRPPLVVSTSLSSGCASWRKPPNS